MYLVAAESGDIAGAGDVARKAIHDRWADFPISILSHHGADCCESARSWLCNMDFAQLNGSDRASGPRWIRKQYEWGPSAWPLHWCEALGSDVIDCGAHSALAHEAFRARGLTAFRVQFVQSYDARAVAQWRTKWQSENVSDHWLGQGHIYHEGNALLVGDDEVKLWDGSAGHWLNPAQTRGYGSILALRLFSEGADETPPALRWGSHHFPPDVWHSFD